LCASFTGECWSPPMPVATCPIKSRPVGRPGPRVRVIREKTPTITVTRKVDPTGSVSFAGTGYRVGNGYRGRSVEVSLCGDTVQITLAGKIVRTRQARHDKHKELGAFANPKGRPKRKKAS
jgi:Mu transposase, C-terminal domain